MSTLLKTPNNLVLLGTISLLMLSACKSSSKSKEGTPPGSGPGIEQLRLEARIDVSKLHKHEQILKNWCWAANAQTVIEYFENQAIDQCTVAGEEIGATGSPFKCCPRVLGCNVTRWPQKVFWNRHLEFQRRSQVLSPTELEKQIVSGSPVLFAWRWTDGTAHMQLAYAYKIIDGELWISVIDPLSVRTTISYDEYDHSETHSHSLDYYAFRKHT
jgi:Papain-like cysteine protease AvrRpt2